MTRASSISKRAQDRRAAGWVLPKQRSVRLLDGRKRITCADCGMVWEASLSDRRVFCYGCRVDRRKKQAIQSFLRNIGEDSHELFDALWLKQSGTCAICDAPVARESRRARLAIDHDHDTGRVRGLLCESCNLGIGQFRDDLNLLERAYTYVVSDGDAYVPEQPDALVKAALDMRYWECKNDYTAPSLCVTCWSPITHGKGPGKNRKHCGDASCRKSQWRTYLAVRQLRVTYQCSYDRVLVLLSQRARGCAICGTKKTSVNKSLSIDHNHATGQVRGFLCDRCNYGIGQLQDDARVLERAVDYLNSFANDVSDDNNH